jgi:hypothetical protein
MSGEAGTLVVKVDVKENVEEGLMIYNTELFEARVSSVKANSLSSKANQLPGCPRRVWVTQSYLGQTKVTLA